MSVTELPLIQPFVVNGADAFPNEFPHQIRIQYNKELQCGGTILDAIFILTAAHCVTGQGIETLPSRFEIIAGDQHRGQNDSTEQHRNVSHIFIHEGYNSTANDFLNDIALLALTHPLNLTSKAVRKIEYPKVVTEFRGTAILTGWGRTHADDILAKVLQKAKIQIISKPFCRTQYSENNVTIADSMICLDGDVKISPCKGDSGGPLLCPVEGKNVLCGITSFGMPDCGESIHPSVYTDVSYFHNWIHMNMKNYTAMTGKCKTNEFYCPKNNTCLYRSQICDKSLECFDGYSESSCPYNQTATETDFICSNGKVINQTFVCDAVDNCGDGSDEAKCIFKGEADCGKDDFICKSDRGRCINKSWKCDGTFDCDDNSDEELMPCIIEFMKDLSTSSSKLFCKPNFFNCFLEQKHKCIKEGKKCDAVADCTNGEDEWYCTEEIK